MKEGKVACFRRGKLMVGPKRPDPRSYADVAAADDTGDRTHATTPERSADHVNNAGRGQGNCANRRSVTLLTLEATTQLVRPAVRSL